jgi:hypothetical protein
MIQHLTRADAMAAGMLIDASEAAREVGIGCPLAVTRAAWQRCVRAQPGMVRQDEESRLWDVAWMLACAIRRGASGPEVRFGVYLSNDSGHGSAQRVRLKAIVGAGDKGEPVMTVLLGDEE